MNTNTAILLFLLSFLSHSQITSRPIHTTYTQYGAFQSFQISYKPAQDLCPTCYLQVTFPEAIHASTAPLSYSIIDENSIVYVQSALSIPPTSNTYYFYPSILLSKSIWYNIIIWPSKQPTLVTGLVGIIILADVNPNSINYDSNKALQYYHLESTTLPPLNLAISIVSSISTTASQIYPLLASITSTVSSPETTLIKLIFTNQIYASLTPLSPIVQNNNFNFVGSCQIVCNNTACINPLSCIVRNNNIELTLPYLPIGSFTLSFTVMNPGFVDSTGLAAQVTTQTGTASGIGILNNVFSVSSISILASQINLHWGIPLSIVQGTMGLGLFVDGGWNTVDVGFTVTSVTMIGTQFMLKLYVGATNVIKHSINTNLPSLNGTSKMFCDYIFPEIICQPIDAFTTTSHRYYIKFKTYIRSSDNIANFGSITISLVNSNNVLFNPLIQTLSIPKIPCSDYKDNTGFHSSSYNIKQTQVIGSPDNQLVNATSTFMNQFFTSNTSFVGIDPSIGNQQLVFLLKTSTLQFSSSVLASASQTYQMKVHINPKIFSSIDKNGIDITAYDANSMSYRGDAVSCYINSSTSPTIQIYQCQTYRDYIYGNQIDNTYTDNTFYGTYSFRCGSGQITVCPVGQSCAESCRIFKGKNAVNGYSGVFSIRNAVFVAGYQSPYLANEMTFDFIIGFYQGGTLVSASLINAYTIKQSRLPNLRLQFYNTYLSSTKSNDGSRIPTLLNLNGYLSISQINATNYDEFALFLPPQATVNRYIQTNGRVGCTHECSSNSVVPLPILCIDNWVCKQKVSIKGIINLGTSIDFKIPIEIMSSIASSFELAFLQSSVIVKIYRINGSSISELLSPSGAETISVTSYSNPWSSGSYWVKTATDTYSQGLNLNMIADFSVSNSIDMLGSALTYNGVPSFTFASAYTSIFLSYSTVTANNLPTCNSPFTYTYQSSYNITVLWCALLPLAPNQVMINYPFYSSSLGANFPFSTIFAYAISDGNGNMIALRTQSNSKTSKSVCNTVHLTNYNYADVVQQQLLLSISIKPISIGSPSNPHFQIRVTLPSQLPVSFSACTATETLLNANLNCNVVSSSLSVGVLQISSNQLMTVTSLQLGVWVSPAGAATVTAFGTYFYGINIQLPQTDASGNAAFNGVQYSPFASIDSSCSGYLNFINVVATGLTIFVNSITMKGVALNYYTDLTFTVKFSSARPNILITSEIDIIFTNILTTPITTCTLWSPQNYLFSNQIIQTNGVRLIPRLYDTPFTFTIYTVTCINLLPSQNTISVKISWIENANILQQSSITSYTQALRSSTLISGTLISKNYNTVGYNSQFTISLSLATAVNDDVQVWIGVGENDINSIVLECYYLSNALKQQVYCVNDWSGKIHIIFTAVTSPNIKLSVFGIRQNTQTPPTLLVLIGINNLNYYYSTISDTLVPSIIGAQPIVIRRQVLQSNFSLQLTVSFPIAYSNAFYVQLDETLITSAPTLLNCNINGVVQSCLRASPNLIIFQSMFAFTPNLDHTLQIYPLKVTKFDTIDPRQIHFKLFAMSGTAIIMGSHQHLSPAYLLDQLPTFSPFLLGWSQQNLNCSWIYHQVFIGYYGKPVFLSPFNLNPFSQNFQLASLSVNLNTYINLTGSVLLGTAAFQLDLAYIGSKSGRQIDYLIVSHSNIIYSQPSFLPISISNQKCIIKSEYNTYQTYAGGVTLPILLDFSLCRPATQHTFTYTLSSPELIIDYSLTNQNVNSTFYQVYIFVRQAPTNPLLNGLFTLTIQFSGAFASSFNVVSSVGIKVNLGTILQIPQSMPPAIEYLNNSFINLTLQCNQASKIYWALGLYPTIQSITYEMIQTQLVNGKEGVRSRVYDPYSWSEELYGMDYEYYPNKNKTLIIDTLRGDRNYILKYFCINLLDSASGGQVITFTTNSTGFGLNKIQIQMNRMLTIYEGNQIACYIAEVLLTPYWTVITSTFSNCINTSLTYFSTPNTTYFDQMPSNNSYSYFFYVDSLYISSNNIRQQLPVNLPNYTSFAVNIGSYSSISMIPLINSYDPIVKNKSFTIDPNGVICTVDVGVVRSYLIVAYMNQTFDPMKMTAPSQYMIKQGNFSSASQFNQVFMKYGSNNITVNITGLQPYSNYSIFYFVTVDNSALNSRYTNVYFENIQTSVYLTYDLGESNLPLILSILSLLMMASLF